MVGFIFGGNTGLSYGDLQDKRARADLLAAQILNQQPKTVAQGIGAVLGGIGVGLNRRQAQQGMREGTEKATSGFQDYLKNRILGQQPSSASGSAANLPMPGAANEMAASAPGGGGNNYRNAIASIESAGSGDYSAVGPTNPKMGRALGRYQIMEANIGPWSREALGREVSADEFMSNPQLQDAIFDHRFGSYVKQYGPEGAAQAWFAGPGGVGKTNRKDVLGTDVGTYGRKFMSALGPTNEVASLDPSAGMPPAMAAIERTAPASGYVDPQVSAPNAAPPQQTAALPVLPSRDVAPPPAVASQPQQMPQQAPQQVAQVGGGVDPQLLKYASDPFLPPEMRAQAQMLLEQQMRQQEATQDEERWRNRQNYEQQQRQADPAYQLGLQQTQAEIERMNKPGYRMLTGDERKAYGIPEFDNRPYQISRDGQVSAVGGMGQSQTPGVEASQREALAKQYGIDPNSAEGQRFILTGTLPTSDRGVTAGDREAIRDADDMVNTGEATLGLIDRAIELSGKAYEGAGAGTRALVASQWGDEGALATREFDNIITEQALGQLKSIFGGAPTEGERAILLEVQGSSSQPKAVRDAILQRARKAVERRLNYNRDRANELRGGTYYKPRSQPNAPANIGGYQIEQVD